MTTLRHIISAFFGGEIDPMLVSRVDSDQYAFGLETCENFIPLNEGPLVKRPGYVYVCDADPTSTWLSNFRFSITQDYLLEWGEQQVRFFTNGVRIESVPGVAYEVATPYSAAQAPRLSTQQSYDRQYIDHEAHPPGSLNRTGALTFSYSVTPFSGGPFLDENSDKAVTVTVDVVAAVGASVNVTATSAIFVPGMVGSFFRIEAKDFSDIKAWEAGMKGTAIGDIVRHAGNAYQAETAAAGTQATGGSPPIHIEGSEWDGLGKKDINDKGEYGVKWKHLHGKFGVIKITAVSGAGTVATGEVIQRLPNSVVTVPTHRWAHSAWSNAKGWPHLVVHAFGRQVHFKDFDIFGSVSGDYRNHAALTPSGQFTPDVAFRRNMALTNPPLWARPDLRKIVLGTADGEYAVGAVNNAQAVAGDNIQSEPQSDYGSAAIWPVALGMDTVFVEIGGRRIRAANYDFARDRYVPSDLTAAARHITKSGLRQLVPQKLPYAFLHGVRGDGQIIVHTSTRLEIKSFIRTILGGSARALSAACVFNDAGDADEQWVLIERKRAPDGPLIKEIWRQATWRELGDAQEEAFFVDGGVRIAAAAGQTAFPGLAHLAGQAVAVLANGGVVPGMTVSGTGVLTLPARAVPDFAFTVIVGLSYQALAIPMSPEPRQRGETVQGLLQIARKIQARLIETLGLIIGTKGDGGYEVIDRPGNAAMDQAIPLFTGDTAGHTMADPKTRTQPVFRSVDPLPCIIAASMLKMEVDTRDV